MATGVTPGSRFASLIIVPIAFACSGDSGGEPVTGGAADFTRPTTNQEPATPAEEPPGEAAPASDVPRATEGQGEMELAGGAQAAPEGGGSAESAPAQPEAETPPPVENAPVVEPPNAALAPVENSGIDCVIATLPAANQLPAVATHPDPFLSLAGNRISTVAEWTCRRAEIKAQVEQYESGPKPVVDKANVTGQFANNQLTVGVSDQGRNVSFSLAITRPNGAPAEPIPLVIGVGGNSLDATVFTSNGVALANLNNNAIGAQGNAQQADGSYSNTRGQGLFYDLYGANHPASSMIAWAWGVSRVIDALEKTPEANIDTRRIAVTGCSRNGKGALTVGAFDERIALTIPQESGAGGSSSWRVAQAASGAGENIQTLSNAAGEQPWFRANFSQNFGNNNVSRLPIDQHSVMGMVAPRALLVLDNEIDWLGIDATFTSGSIAHRIWDAFGLSDKMGYWQTAAHQHCQFPASQRAALEAYVKKFLVGGGTDDTNLLRGDAATADLQRWVTWTAPALQ